MHASLCTHGRSGDARSRRPEPQGAHHARKRCSEYRTDPCKPAPIAVVAIWARGAAHRLEMRILGRGAVAVCRIGELAQDANHHPDVDWRYDTLFVTLTSHDAGGKVTARDAALARSISSQAAAFGAVARPELLRTLEIAIDTDNAEGISGTWKTALGYKARKDGSLADPFGRGPALWFQETETPNTNRFHLDVMIPFAESASVLEALSADGVALDYEHAPMWVRRYRCPGKPALHLHGGRAGPGITEGTGANRHCVGRASRSAGRRGFGHNHAFHDRGGGMLPPARTGDSRPPAAARAAVNRQVNVLNGPISRSLESTCGLRHRGTRNATCDARGLPADCHIRHKGLETVAVRSLQSLCRKCEPVR